MLRQCVWQLYPIVKGVISHPKNKFVNTLAALFNIDVSWELLSWQQLTGGYPIVLLSTQDLATEAKTCSTTHEG